MSLRLQRSDAFLGDFEGQYRWYFEQAGTDVADRYLRAVWQTLQSLVQFPGQGRLRNFAHPALRGIRSVKVLPPYGRHLVFYRYTETDLFAERIMHGARDLSHRPAESPPKESGPS
jgi:plasmid stabilization system protein ParE